MKFNDRKCGTGLLFEQPRRLGLSKDDTFHHEDKD